jgi:hypothetical protein
MVAKMGYLKILYLLIDTIFLGVIHISISVTVILSMFEVKKIFFEY